MELLRDLRLGARLALRQPGFTALAVLAMAVGIGVLTATFSLLDAVLLEPLPYPGAGRLVSIQSHHPELGGNQATDARIYAAFAREARSLDRAGAVINLNLQVDAGAGPQPVQAALATPSFLEILGARAALGRTLSPGDGRPGGSLAAVVSHRLWQSLLGGERDAIGRAVRASASASLGGIQFQDAAVTVVGVLPEDFQPPFPSKDPQVWIAAALEEEGLPVLAFGRLREDWTLERAAAELGPIRSHLAAGGEGAAEWRLKLVPLRELLAGNVRRPAQILFLAGLLVAVVAVADTAFLVSARSRRRASEVAVRALLGAGRGRLLRQLLAEGLVIAAPAGVLGAALAWAALQLFRGFGMAGIPRRFTVELDATVLALTALATLGTALALAAVPALRLSRLRPSDVLAGGSTETARGIRSAPLRFLFVAFQVGLALAAVVAASLLLRSFSRLLRIDPGFDPRGVATAWITLPPDSYPDALARAGLYQRLRAALAGLPEVEEAGLVSYLPLSRGSGGMDFGVEDGRDATLEFRAVTPGYLEALGIPLRAGRPFREADLESQPVIVSESAARLLWGDRPPLGQRLKMGGLEAEGPWSSVIGVAADVRHDSLTSEGAPTVYVPFPYVSQMAVAVRSKTGETERLAAALARTIKSVDPSLPVADLQPMSQLVEAGLARMRTSSWLLGLLSGTALLLAALGVYGAIAHTVAEREREIRIRFALGALPSDVLRWIAWKVLPWVALGLAAGLAGALALARYLAPLLYEVRPTDSGALAAALALVAAAAGLSLLLPARRACRLEPVSYR